MGGFPLHEHKRQIHFRCVVHKVGVKSQSLNHITPISHAEEIGVRERVVVATWCMVL